MGRRRKQAGRQQPVIHLLWILAGDRRALEQAILDANGTKVVAVCLALPADGREALLRYGAMEQVKADRFPRVVDRQRGKQHLELRHVVLIQRGQKGHGFHGHTTSLHSRSHAADGDHHAADAQQDQVYAGETADGGQSKQGVEQHEDPQEKADDVDRQGEVIGPLSRDEADIPHVGQAGDTVGDKPDGEQDRQHQRANPRIHQQHHAGHDAQNARDQGKDWAKARVAVHPNVQEDVRHAHHHRGNAVGKHQGIEDEVRLC